MRQRRLISTGVASLLCGLAALATLALGAPKDPKAGNGPPSQVPVGNGQVEITLSKTSDVLNFSNAVIGDYRTGSVTVGNGGKLAADFSLSGDLVIPTTSPGASALADQLQLQVSRTASNTSPTPLYLGSVSGFNAAGALPLGKLYPKQGPKQPKSVTLNFQLSFPSTGTDAGDNALQNLGPIDQRFVIDAAQSAGSTSNGNGPPTTVPPKGNPNTTRQAVITSTGSPSTVPPLAPIGAMPTTGKGAAPKSSKRATSGAVKKLKKKRGKRARKVKAKLASSSESIGEKLRGNGVALALFALAAALALSLTLPPKGRDPA